MDYIKANKQFDALDYFPTNIQEILMAEGRVFSTRTKFNEFEALKAKGEPPIGCPYKTEQTTYSGTIVTFNPEDWEEAKQIAIIRGWNESVDGILCDIIPFDEADKANLNTTNLN